MRGRPHEWTTRGNAGKSMGVTKSLRLLPAAMLFAVSAPAAATPDIELGRYLARECITCHRTATATSTIPNIFGMASSHMTDVIRAYRDKKLENAVMQAIAGRLKDDEIEALAAYFAMTTKP
jgi:cytochrome c553